MPRESVTFATQLGPMGEFHTDCEKQKEVYRTHDPMPIVRPICPGRSTYAKDGSRKL